MNSSTRATPSPLRTGPLPRVARRAIGIALLVATALPARESAAADTSGVAPRIDLPTYPVKADDVFQWIVPLKLVNPTHGGIYTDSLRLEIEDQDQGETRRSRRFAYTMTDIAQLLPSVSSRDSGLFRFQCRAFSEQAHVTVRLYSHGGDGTSYESVGELSVGPGMMTAEFPSRFIERGKHKIEYCFANEVWPPKASPGLLIVHGEGSHARHMLPIAWYLANRGYSVMVMSLPGYGLSSGPPDLAGPRAIEAVEAALDQLRRTANIDSTRIAMWGISQGATAVLQVAARRHDVKAVAAQSGLYDLQAVAATTTSEEMRRTLHEEAGPARGWKKRSPMTSIRTLAAPVFLLHGDADGEAPNAQVNEYATALKAAGKDVTLKLLPGQGHQIPAQIAQVEVDKFLESYLAPVRRGRN